MAVYDRRLLHHGLIISPIIHEIDGWGGSEIMSPGRRAAPDPNIAGRCAQAELRFGTGTWEVASARHSSERG